CTSVIRKKMKKSNDLDSVVCFQKERLGRRRLRVPQASIKPTRVFVGNKQFFQKSFIFACPPRSASPHVRFFLPRRLLSVRYRELISACFSASGGAFDATSFAPRHPCLAFIR